MNNNINNKQNPITRKFIRFIRERALKIKYEKNYNEYAFKKYEHSPLHEFFKTAELNGWYEDFIDCPFQWRYTDEGDDFWEDIYEDWMKLK